MSIMEIPVQNCIVGILLTCPIGNVYTVAFLHRVRKAEPILETQPKTLLGL